MPPNLINRSKVRRYCTKDWECAGCGKTIYAHSGQYYDTWIEEEQPFPRSWEYNITRVHEHKRYHMGCKPPPPKPLTNQEIADKFGVPVESLVLA